jgi:hypothetical protein
MTARGDFKPDDIPDSVVIQAAITEHLGGVFEDYEQTSNAVLSGLLRYGRVVVPVDLLADVLAGWKRPADYLTAQLVSWSRLAEIVAYAQRRDGRRAITDPVGEAERREAADHIVTHQPRDTIARCEADLMELGRHVLNFAGDCQLCDESAPCESLRINAYGLRNRPGWQEGWKP